MALLTRLMPVFAWLDRRNIRDLTPEEVTSSVEEAKLFDADPVIRQLQIEYQLMDGKTASLMTHLSLMTAAVSLLYSAMQSPVIKVFLLLKIIWYLAAMLFALRVIFYLDYADIGCKDRHGVMMRELKTRVRYFRVAHYLASLGVPVLIVVLLLSLLSGPVP